MRAMDAAGKARTPIRWRFSKDVRNDRNGQGRDLGLRGYPFVGLLRDSTLYR